MASSSTCCWVRVWTLSCSGGLKSPRASRSSRSISPVPQAWKRQRLVDLGFGIPEGQRFVPVDFETRSRGGMQLLDNGFDTSEPAVVASLGVSMYLTTEATAATMRQIATLAPGSTFAMTFLQPLELVAADEKAMHQATDAAARASGTPFISYYSAGRHPRDGTRCRLHRGAARHSRTTTRGATSPTGPTACDRSPPRNSWSRRPSRVRRRRQARSEGADVRRARRTCHDRWRHT